MARNEAQTRFDLIDPALFERGWSREDIRLEETAAAIDIIHGRGQRRPAGRADYVLRRPLESETKSRSPLRSLKPNARTSLPSTVSNKANAIALDTSIMFRLSSRRMDTCLSNMMRVRVSRHTHARCLSFPRQRICLSVTSTLAVCPAPQARCGYWPLATSQVVTSSLLSGRIDPRCA